MSQPAHPNLPPPNKTSRQIRFLTFTIAILGVLVSACLMASTIGFLNWKAQSAAIFTAHQAGAVPKGALALPPPLVLDQRKGLDHDANVACGETALASALSSVGIKTTEDGVLSWLRSQFGETGPLGISEGSESYQWTRFSDHIGAQAFPTSGSYLDNFNGQGYLIESIHVDDQVNPAPAGPHTWYHSVVVYAISSHSVWVMNPGLGALQEFSRSQFAAADAQNGLFVPINQSLS